MADMPVVRFIMRLRMAADLRRRLPAAEHRAIHAFGAYINPYPLGDPVAVRIIDFIAGMTDNYALNLFQKIGAPNIPIEKSLLPGGELTFAGISSKIRPQGKI